MKVSSVRNRSGFGLAAFACKVSAISVLTFCLVLASSVAQAVDNVQVGYAGADAGDWGGKNGAVIAVC